MISKRAVLSCLTFALAAASATYAQTPTLPPFTVEKVTPNVQCLHSLANVTVLTGRDGLLVVDSGVREQAAELAAKGEDG